MRIKNSFSTFLLAASASFSACETATQTTQVEINQLNFQDYITSLKIPRAYFKQLSEIMERDDFINLNLQYQELPLNIFNKIFLNKLKTHQHLHSLEFFYSINLQYPYVTSNEQALHELTQSFDINLCTFLMVKYPELKSLFPNYVKRQLAFKFIIDKLTRLQNPIQ